MKRRLLMIACFLFMIVPSLAFANSNITVRWNASPETDISNYNIYKVIVNKGDTTGNHILMKDGGTPTQVVPVGTEAFNFTNQTDGFYAVVVTSVDEVGNESNKSIEVVERVDTTDPVIILLGDAVMTLERGSVFTDPGATASDNLDGDITSLIIVVGNVNPNTVGNYTLTYGVADESMLTASVARNIAVVDNIPPSPPTGVEILWAKIVAWLKCNMFSIC
jgi:hypothetical protein